MASIKINHRLVMVKKVIIFSIFLLSCNKENLTPKEKNQVPDNDITLVENSVMSDNISVSQSVKSMGLDNLLEIITGVWESPEFDYKEIYKDEEMEKNFLLSLRKIKLGTGFFWSTPTSLVINCVGENKFLSVQGTHPKKLLKFDKTGDGQVDISLESTQGDERILGVLRVTVINEEEMFLEEISSPFFSNGRKFYTSGWIEFGKKNVWHKFIYKKE